MNGLSLSNKSYSGQKREVFLKSADKNAKFAKNQGITTLLKEISKALAMDPKEMKS